MHQPFISHRLGEHRYCKQPKPVMPKGIAVGADANLLRARTRKGGPPGAAKFREETSKKQRHQSGAARPMLTGHAVPCKLYVAAHHCHKRQCCAWATATAN